MNTKREDILSIIAALVILFSALMDTKAILLVAVVVLLGLLFYKLTRP